MGRIKTMTLDYENSGHFFYFDFSGTLTPQSKILCPECLEYSAAIEWKHWDAYCEICGDHAAIVCPKCDDFLDHVWTNTLTIR